MAGVADDATSAVVSPPFAERSLDDASLCPCRHGRHRADARRLFRDPGLPDSWIMTDGKKVVQVFSVLGTSTLRTSEGIWLGDSIDKLKAAYPDLRFQGSDHAAPPAGSYYTAGPNEPGLRFATDGSKVVEISAGRQPWLGAAEGCA